MCGAIHWFPKARRLRLARSCPSQFLFSSATLIWNDGGSAKCRANVPAAVNKARELPGTRARVVILLSEILTDVGLLVWSAQGQNWAT